MSTWLHCNLCYKIFSKSVAFSFTSCGHIYCSDCLKKGSDPCHICQKKCKVLCLNEKLDINLQSYFSSPHQLIKKYLEVVDFQGKHRRRLMEHLYSKNERLSQMLRQGDKAVSALHEELRKLKSENRSLKKYILSLKAHSEGQTVHRPTTPIQLYKFSDSPDTMSPRSSFSSMRGRPGKRGAGDGQLGMVFSPSYTQTPKNQLTPQSNARFKEKLVSSGPKRLSMAPRPVDGKIFTPKKPQFKGQGISESEIMSPHNSPYNVYPMNQAFNAGGLQSTHPTPPSTPSVFSRQPSACPSPLIRFEKAPRTAWK